MPEVQSIGAADYTQYQPSQYPAENYAEDYSMQPEVYDENAAQMRAESKSRKGAMAVAALAIAGLALWGGHAWGKRSAKDIVANYEKVQQAADELKNAAAKEKEKAKNIVDNYDKVQNIMDEIEKAAEEGNNKWFGENHCGTKLLAKIKELSNSFKKTVEDAKNKIKEITEKAEEETKSTADKLE